MTEHSEEAQEVTETIQRRENRSGLIYLLLGVLLAALLVTLYLLIEEVNGKDDDLSNLRTQFIYCADLENAEKPYCSKPVVGPEGQQGDEGAQGEPGPPGEDGEPGSDGTDGASGAPGDDGRAGRPGASGSDGQNGVAGETGASGSDGKNGQDGAQGATGPKGDPGPQGEQGQQGPAGPAGEQGPAGPSGIAQVVNQCAVPEGEFVTGIDTSYDASTQTLTVTCTSGSVLFP